MKPGTARWLVLFAAVLLALPACGAGSRSRPRDGGPDGAPPDGAAPPDGGGTPDAGGGGGARLPLELVAEVALPGGTTRFDYQDVDVAQGLLAIAHMGDGELLIVDLADGAERARLPGIATVRGVLATDGGRIYATAAGSNELVTVDDRTLAEVGRVQTGRGPDGLGWDPGHGIVAVSDQRDGAVSLIADAGAGERRQVPLGAETGNVVFDAARGQFWVAVVRDAPPDQLVAVDPADATAVTRIDLPGCTGAHGVRLHPDGASALVACEGNDRLLRVELSGAHAVVGEAVGAGPDVLAVDPGLGWLYVAAESGDLTVFDLGQPGLVVLDREHPADAAHSVAVDPATHRVFFPLPRGGNGRPALRIMRPAGL